MTVLTKAIKIAMAIVPLLMKAIPEIEAKVAAAKAPTSEGGAKVEPLEIAQIVVDELPGVFHALVDAVVSAVA